MIYCLQGLCHRTDIDMGQHGFCISLHPCVPLLVEKSNIDQAGADHAVVRYGRTWLDCAGYDTIFDPDNCGHHRDEALPPGPNAQPLHRPGFDLRVSWGEWGPEHIEVPGNACGLDLDTHLGCSFAGGRVLAPHNVDTLQQKYLLLMVFSTFAEHVLCANRARLLIHTEK